VVSFLAIGLHGRVAKVLEKATVLVSDDGLAWIRRTGCSPVICAGSGLPCCRSPSWAADGGCGDDQRLRGVAMSCGGV